MIELPLLGTPLRIRTEAGPAQVWDSVRRQWVLLTPEEHVRQLLLNCLIGKMQYPAALIALERGLSIGHTVIRFDLAVYHRDKTEPWLLAECKAPDVLITDDTLQQLLRYHSRLQSCRYWLLTNGHQTFCADAIDPMQIRWLTALPAY